MVDYLKKTLQILANVLSKVILSTSLVGEN